MADIIDVLINLERADFKQASSLPVSLGIKTDKFLSVVGTDGNTIDNPAKQMLLPGTLNNQGIMSKMGNTNQCSIIKNGTTIFAGKCLLAQQINKQNRIGGYGLKLYGGTIDIFSQLKGSTLRGLELGTSDWTQDNVQASWDQSYDTGFNALWAPVYYGYMDGAGSFSTLYMRPHIYYPAIMDAIAKKLRVTISSQLMATQDFKKMVYLFGVGDQWAADDSLSNFDVENTTTTIVGGNAVGTLVDINFDTETADPGGIWSGTSGTVPGGQWEFTLYPKGGQDVVYIIQVGSVYSQTINVDQTGTPVTVGPITINTSETVKISVASTHPNGDGLIQVGTRLVGKQVIGAPAVGNTILLSSCLHGEPIVEFLRGMSHTYNLAWYFDPIRRVLHVDPRFGFKDSDGVEYPGFYERVGSISGGDAPEDWNSKIDRNSISYTRGFNKSWIEFNNKPEPTSWYETARERLASNGMPYLGSRFTFDETGQDGDLSENPYFENLLLALESTSPSMPYMPVVMPEADDEATQVPEPTFISNPKYAYYGGNINTIGKWNWEGSFIFNRPALWQQPPDKSDELWNVGYATAYPFVAFAGLGPNPGLVSKYYMQWLAIRKNAAFMSANVYLDNADVYPRKNLFKRLKLIPYLGSMATWVFMGADAYQPFTDKPAKGKFARCIMPREKDKASLVSSTQNNLIGFTYTF